MMKKYQLNYLIMLSMFVFTVSSCGFDPVKIWIDTRNSERANTIGQLNVVKSLNDAGVEFDAKHKVSIKLIGEELGFKRKAKYNILIEQILDGILHDVVYILRDAGFKADTTNEILIKMASVHFEFIKSLKEVDFEDVTLLNRGIKEGSFEMTEARVPARLLSGIDEGDLKIKEALSEPGVKVDAGEHNIMLKMLKAQLDAFETLLQAGFKFEMNAANNRSIHIALAKGFLEYMKAQSELGVETQYVDALNEWLREGDLIFGPFEKALDKVNATIDKCNGIFKD